MMERLLTLLLFLSFFRYLHGQRKCSPPSGRPSCVCKTDDGSVIDLTSIANSDGSPRYTGSSLSDPNGYTYSYNPCYGFGIGNSGCTRDTAACQNERNEIDQYNCGSSVTETFIFNPNGDNRLEYTGGQQDRTTVVTLHCDTTAITPRVTTNGDSLEYFVYTFDLYSVCACPGGCGKGAEAGGSGVAPGAVGIVIIFLIIGCFISYFIVGAIILKIKFEKTGLDMIPQKSFWFDVPSLVKDGCIFTISPIQNLVSGTMNNKSSERYESL